MISNREIEKRRPVKNLLDPDIPYHFLQETEPGPAGNPEKVNTIFLTARECAFRCLMCDLWKNTLSGPTPPGAIPRQIDHALARLPAATVIKLYNNGNFFDVKSIPPSDYPGILARIKPYRRLVVENHPALCTSSCLDFKDRFPGTLEIAMGLETIHPDVLPKLNKQLIPEDFKKAASFLRNHQIEVRAFILLNPPYLTGKEANREWVLKTVQFAFDSGAGCCSIIATRPGNGMLEFLGQEGNYIPPTLELLEQVFEDALNLKQGRVFVDTWDIGFLSDCPRCFEARKQRLEKMNNNQILYQRIACSCQNTDE